jgi:hypothetical protein
LDGLAAANVSWIDVGVLGHCDGTPDSTAVYPRINVPPAESGAFWIIKAIRKTCFRQFARVCNLPA